VQAAGVVQAGAHRKGGATAGLWAEANPLPPDALLPLAAELTATVGSADDAPRRLGVDTEQVRALAARGSARALGRWREPRLGRHTGARALLQAATPVRLDKHDHAS
jgi:hypothetical protein